MMHAATLLLWAVSCLQSTALSVEMNAMARPTVLVTGSTDGIGVTTAKNLAAKGYNVLIHGRSQERIQKAAATVRAFAADCGPSQDDITVCPLAPADISTVAGCEALVRDVQKTCADNQLHLCVLMNNAGVYSEELIRTDDGLEQTFAVNVMATFVITSMLLPQLLQRKSRIVIASSISQCGSIRHWEDLQYASRSFSAHGSYSESKLFDAMLSMEFAKRLEEAGYGTDQITCNCLDPGTVNTKMLFAGWGPCGIDVEDALDQTWLCSDDEVEDTTGEYFVWKSSRRASGSAYEQKERDKLWKVVSDIAPKAASMWDFKSSGLE